MKLITLTGPAYSGTSSTAKAVKQSLREVLNANPLMVNSGNGYRALAKLHELNNQSEPDPDIDVLLAQAEEEGFILKENSVVLGPREWTAEELKATPWLSDMSSVLSAKQPVRDYINAKVRRLVSNHTDWVIYEGRDGPVVFPGDHFHFYLDVSEEVAHQRALAAGHHNLTIDDIRSRNKRDTERDVCPLRKFDECVIINTDLLTPEEVLEEIFSQIP